MPSDSVVKSSGSWGSLLSWDPRNTHPTKIVQPTDTMTERSLSEAQQVPMFKRTRPQLRKEQVNPQ